MKTLTITLMLAATLIVGLAASGVAVAGGGVYYGGYHGGARVGVGVYVGPGWWGPRPYYWGPGPYYYPYGVYGAPYYYPPAPYYYPPAVVAPSQPPAYVERDPQPSAPPAPSTQPAPSAQPQQSWFYCPSTKAYYPYVRECPEGWQRVAPQPPS